eukprot:TRINITY_DN9655_c0_g1_i3.p1 TRINITY_DN9655_c0_g1~~TRINITY_DN9655_c0_g1_i3.p1  ORF type:complete len:245 (+),score=41.98 TRINITY_DN9655_c0_g1_i3:66-800(+)
MSALVWVVSSIGSALTLVLFLSPRDIIKKIRAAKTTEGFSFFPFVCMFLNCGCWTCYGVVVGNPIVVFLNLTGFLITFVNVLNFYTYLPETEVSKWTWILVGSQGFLYYFTGICSFVFPDNLEDISGTFAIGANMISYGAPLIKLYEVVKTKSVESMSFGFSIMGTIVPFLWVIYSQLIGDVYILIPNSVGFIFGCIQILLFVIYGREKFSVANFKSWIASFRKAAPGSRFQSLHEDETRIQAT